MLTAEARTDLRITLPPRFWEWLQAEDSLTPCEPREGECDGCDATATLLTEDDKCAVCLVSFQGYLQGLETEMLETLRGHLRDAPNGDVLFHAVYEALPATRAGL